MVKLIDFLAVRIHMANHADHHHDHCATVPQQPQSPRSNALDNVTVGFGAAAARRGFQFQHGNVLRRPLAHPLVSQQLHGKPN